MIGARTKKVNTVFIFKTSFENQCKKQGKKMYHEPQAFHMGSGQMIHFTEAHVKNKYADFCVDMSMRYRHDTHLEYDDRVANYGGLLNEETSNKNEYDYENSSTYYYYYGDYDPDGTNQGTRKI